METLTQDQFERLTDDATVLERDAYGIKVLETPAREIIKIFRLKRQLSSARLRPYAVRFADNAERLTRLGIPTVEVKRVAYCPEQQRHVLIYPKLPGELLRDALLESEDPSELAAKLGTFMAKLHGMGIYFRSVHLKNVLVLEDGELGLIDISDMSFKRFKLRISLRLRNFGHMLRYDEDKQLLKANLPAFLNAYLEESKLAARNARHIEMGLQKLLTPEND